MVKLIIIFSFFLAGCAGTALNYIPDKGMDLEEARRIIKAFYLDRSGADYVIITDLALVAGKGESITAEAADDTSAGIRGRLFFNNLQTFEFIQTGKKYHVLLQDMNDRPAGKHRFSSQSKATLFLDALWKLKRNAKERLEELNLENLQ